MAEIKETDEAVVHISHRNAQNPRGNEFREFDSIEMDVKNASGWTKSNVNSPVTIHNRSGSTYEEKHEISKTKKKHEKNCPGYCLVAKHVYHKYSIRPYYWITFWIWTICTLIFVYDRFFIESWPRNSFANPFNGKGWAFCIWPAQIVNGTWSGKGLCGNDGPRTIYDDLAPWSLIVFDMGAMFSGRLIITTTSLLFVTKFKCTWTTIAHNPRWSKFLDTVMIDNWDLHVAGGWCIGVCTILHVWVLYLPSIFHGYENVYQTWEESQGVTPPMQVTLFRKRTDRKLRKLFWGIDDFWRLCWMSFIFFLGFPLSRKGTEVNYSLMMWLHVGVGIGFAWDSARRQTHPHVWLLNGPLILWYIIDAWGFRSWYRHNKADKVYRVTLDDKYMLLMWSKLEMGNDDLRGWSDIYWMKRQGGNRLEWMHCFTCCSSFKLSNSNMKSIVSPYFVEDPSWEGHIFNLQSKNIEYSNDFLKNDSQSSNEHNVITFENQARDKRYRLERTEKSAFLKKRDDMFQQNFEEWNRLQLWDQLAICRIHGHDNSKLPCPIRTFQHDAWTKQVANDPEDFIPLDIYGPHTSEYQRLAFHLTQPGGNRPMIVIGTGAGCGLCLDVVSHILSEGIKLVNPVKIYYSARSLPLLQFVANTLLAREIDNLYVHLALTQVFGERIVYDDDNAKLPNFQLGRLNFTKLLNDVDDLDTEVFFCGCGPISILLGNGCHQKGLDFIGSAVE